MSSWMHKATLITAALGAFSIAWSAHADAPDGGPLAGALGGAAAKPLSNTEMGADRGGQGLLGFDFGSTTFVQVGQTKSSKFSPGNPSSSTSSITDPFSNLSASAGMSTNPPPFTFGVNGSFSDTLGATTTHTFTFSSTGF
ncbi:MAG: hypothetical protein ACHP84_11320 [Caulobacterales bacterium]